MLPSSVECRISPSSFSASLRNIPHSAGDPALIRLRLVLAFVLLCIPACGEKPEAPAKKAPAAASVGLDAYKRVKGPTRIKGVSFDASGLTYSSKTKSLFMVINSTCEIVELTLDGKVKRKISTRNFVDIEGIAHVKDDTFCVVEEGRGTLCRITIDEKTESINYGVASVVRIDGKALGNKGLEGLTYDAKGKRFFAVKESRPRKIYEIAEPKADAKTAEVTNPWNIQKKALNMSDLSGVYFHQKSGHLLILSHESSCVVETTLDGKEVSRLSLQSGKSGLKSRVPQAEGITMDDKGTLYICSEPNILYVFKKTSKAKK